MADKAFGVKDINLIGASGTPTIESPNNLNINAVNVAISTDITVAGKVSLGAGTSISSPGSNILTLGTNDAERLRITSGGDVLIADTSNSVWNDTSGGGINLKANGQIVAKKEATSTADPLVWLNDTGQITNKFIVFAQDGNERASVGLAGNDLRFARDGYNETLRITGIGSVGVGLTNPDSRFHVRSTSNHVATFEYSSTSDMAIQLKNSQGSMYFGLGGTEEFAIATDADLNGNNMRFSVDQNGRVRTPDQPAALVYKTGTTQTFTSDGLVTYDETSYNQGGITIGGTRSRMTVPVAGKYMVNACTSGSVTTASAGDGWKIRILKNGTEYNHTYGFPIETTGSSAGQELAYVVTMVVDCAASDYLEIQIENIGGAQAQMSYGYFGIYLLG